MTSCRRRDAIEHLLSFLELILLPTYHSDNVLLLKKKKTKQYARIIRNQEVGCTCKLLILELSKVVNGLFTGRSKH